MDEHGVLARAPVAALSDVSDFLASVEHLKALVLFKIERLTRESRLLISLDRQIEAMTKECESTSKEHPRLVEMWRQVQAEVQADLDKLNRLGMSP